MDARAAESLLGVAEEASASSRGPFDRARAAGHSMASREAIDLALRARSPG